MSINGFINVLKPPGMTSHDVVSLMRRIYRTKKIGHAGTLDPAAAGVLPIAIGYATRLLEYMADTDKKYRAEVKLGLSTDTGDYTGTILKQEEFSMPPADKVKKVLMDFCGDIMQAPPVYSAIKINGQKACDLARHNIEVKLEPRHIKIHDIVFLRSLEDGFSMDVHCSKGTYIRSLCTDIGEKLAIPATMGFLLRTAVGKFKLAEASTIEELAQNPLAAVQGIDILLDQMEEYNVDSEILSAFRQGRKIAYNGSKKYNDGTVLLIHSDAVFAGIGKISDAGASVIPHKVFNDK